MQTRVLYLETGELRGFLPAVLSSIRRADPTLKTVGSSLVVISIQKNLVPIAQQTSRLLGDGERSSVCVPFALTLDERQIQRPQSWRSSRDMNGHGCHVRIILAVVGLEGEAVIPHKASRRGVSHIRRRAA